MNLRFIGYFIVLILALSVSINYAEAATCYAQNTACQRTPFQQGTYVAFEVQDLNSECAYGGSENCNTGCCCDQSGLLGVKVKAVCDNTTGTTFHANKIGNSCNAQLCAQTPSLAPTWNLTGYVLDSNNNAIPNVQVIFDGVSKNTNANGAFNFTNVNEGTYTLSTTVNGCTKNVNNINLNSNKEQNLTIDCASYEISGYVYDESNNKVSGANVEMIIGTSKKSVTTDASGKYVLTQIPYLINAYITATKNGCSGDISISPVNANINNKNIILSCTKYSVSGKVLRDNENQENIVVSTNRGANVKNTTTLNGYSFVNLAGGFLTLSVTTNTTGINTETCTGSLNLNLNSDLRNQDINLKCCTETCTESECINGQIIKTCKKDGNIGCSYPMETLTTRSCSNTKPGCEWNYTSWNKEKCEVGDIQRTRSLSSNNGGKLSENCDPTIYVGEPILVEACPGQCGDGVLNLSAGESCDMNLKNTVYNASNDCIANWTAQNYNVGTKTWITWNPISDATNLSKFDPRTMCNLQTCQCLPRAPPIIPPECVIDPGAINITNITLIRQNPGFNVFWNLTNQTCEKFVDHFELRICDNKTGACKDLNSFQNVQNPILKTIRNYSHISNGNNPIEIKEKTEYCYEIKVQFNDSVTLDNRTKTAIKCEYSGDDKCMNPTTNSWCVGKEIKTCDDKNRVVPGVPDSQCGPNTYCTIENNEAVCKPQGYCDACNSIFGVQYFTINMPLNDPINPLTSKRVACPTISSPAPNAKTNPFSFSASDYVYGCYKDYSLKTTLDEARSCEKVTSCYDYRSQDSCQNDYCEKFGVAGTNTCEWTPYPLFGTNYFGKGLCRPKVAEEQNCKLYNNPEYTRLFPVVTQDICKMLGNCYYNSKLQDCQDGKSITCNTYTTKEDCLGESYTEVKVDANWDNTYANRVSGTNMRLNNSSDQMGIGLCKWHEPSAKCYKDSDNNAVTTPNDCSEVDSQFSAICNTDFVPPTTTITNRSHYGLLMDLNGEISIKDNNPWGVSDSDNKNIKMYYCVVLEGKSCYPNKVMPITGEKKFTVDLTTRYKNKDELGDATNSHNNKFTMYYYSQDPSKNLELIKNFTFILDAKAPNVTLEYNLDSSKATKYQWLTNLSVTLTLKEEEFGRTDCSFILLAPNNPNAVLAFAGKELYNIPSIIPPFETRIDLTKTLKTKYPNLVNGNYPYEITCVDFAKNKNIIKGTIEIDGDARISNPDPKGQVFTSMQFNTVQNKIISVNTTGEAECKYANFTITSYSDPKLSLMTASNDKKKHTATINIPTVNASRIYTYNVACNITINSEKEVIIGDAADSVEFAIDDLAPKTILFDTTTNKAYNATKIPDNKILKLELRCDDKAQILTGANGKDMSLGCKSGATYYCIENSIEDCTNVGTYKNDTTSIIFDYTTPNSAHKLEYGNYPIIHYYSKDNGLNNETPKVVPLNIKNTDLEHPEITLILENNTEYPSKLSEGSTTTNINSSYIKIIVNYTKETAVNITSYALNRITPNINIPLNNLTVMNGRIEFALDRTYIDNGQYKFSITAIDDDDNVKTTNITINIKHDDNYVKLIYPKFGIGKFQTYDIGLETRYNSSCKYDLSEFACSSNKCKYDAFTKQVTTSDNILQNINNYDGSSNKIVYVVCKTQNTLDDTAGYVFTSFNTGFVPPTTTIDVIYRAFPQVYPENKIINNNTQEILLNITTNHDTVCVINRDDTHNPLDLNEVVDYTNYNKLYASHDNYSSYVKKHQYLINVTNRLLSGTTQTTLEYNITCTNLAQDSTTKNISIILDLDNSDPVISSKIDTNINYITKKFVNVTCTDHCTDTFEYNIVPANGACTGAYTNIGTYSQLITITDSAKICIKGYDILGRSNTDELIVEVVEIDIGNITVNSPRFLYNKSIVSTTNKVDISISNKDNATCKYVKTSNLPSDLRDGKNLKGIYDASQSILFNITGNTTHVIKNFEISQDVNTEAEWIFVCEITNADPQSNPYAGKIFLISWDNTPPSITYTANPNPIYDYSEREVTISLNSGSDKAFCYYNNSLLSEIKSNNSRNNNSVYSHYGSTHNHKILFTNPENTLDAVINYSYNISCQNTAGLWSDITVNITYDPDNTITVTRNSPLLYTSNSSGITISVNTSIVADCSLFVDGVDKGWMDANGYKSKSEIVYLGSGLHYANITCKIPGETAVVGKLNYMFVVDLEAPKVNIVANDKTCGLSTLTANVEGSDDIHITNYTYTIAKQGTAGFILSGTSQTIPNTIIYNGALTDNAKYVVSVTAYDVSLKSTSTSKEITAYNSDNSIQCDATPPIITISEPIILNNTFAIFEVNCTDVKGAGAYPSASGCTQTFDYATTTQNTCDTVLYDKSASYYSKDGNVSSKKLIIFDGAKTLCVRGQDRGMQGNGIYVLVNKSLSLNNINCGNNVIDSKPAISAIQNYGALGNYFGWNQNAYDSLIVGSLSESCDGTNLNGKTCMNLGAGISGSLSCNNECQIDTSGCKNGVNVTLDEPLPFGVGKNKDYELKVSSDYDAVCKYGALGQTIIGSYNSMELLTTTDSRTHSVSISDAPKVPAVQYVLCNASIPGYSGDENNTFGILRVLEGYDSTAPTITVTSDKTKVTDWNDRTVNLNIKTTDGSNPEDTVCYINEPSSQFFDYMIPYGNVSQSDKYYSTHNLLIDYSSRYNNEGLRDFVYEITCVNKANMNSNTTYTINYNVSNSQDITITKTYPLNVINKPTYLRFESTRIEIETNIFARCTITDAVQTKSMMYSSNSELRQKHEANINVGKELMNVTVVCSAPFGNTVKTSSQKFEFKGNTTGPRDTIVSVINTVSNNKVCSLNSVTFNFTSTNTGSGIKEYRYTVSDAFGMNDTRIVSNNNDSVLVVYNPNTPFKEGEVYNISVVAIDNGNNPSNIAKSSFVPINSTDNKCDLIKPSVSIIQSNTQYLDIVSINVNCVDNNTGTNSGCSNTYYYKFVPPVANCALETYSSYNPYIVNLTYSKNDTLCVKATDNNNNIVFAEYNVTIPFSILNAVNLTPEVNATNAEILVYPNVIVTNKTVFDLTISSTLNATCRYSNTPSASTNINVLYTNYAPFTITGNTTHIISNYDMNGMQNRYVDVICNSPQLSQTPYSRLIIRVAYVNQSVVPQITLSATPNIVTDFENRKSLVKINSDMEVVCSINSLENTDTDSRNVPHSTGNLSNALTYRNSNEKELLYNNRGVDYGLLKYSVECRNLAGISSTSYINITYNISKDVAISMLSANLQKVKSFKIAAQTSISADCNITFNGTTSSMNRVSALNHEKDVTVPVDGTYDAVVSCIVPTFGSTRTVTYPINVDTTTPLVGCGNNVLETALGEYCDGDKFSISNCNALPSFNYTGGKLKCFPAGSGTNSCKFDTSGCDNGAGTCGNNKIDGPNSNGQYEQCDGSVSNIRCRDLGFDGGTVSCNSNCELNTSRCTRTGTLANTPIECGNGILQSGEQCEGSIFPGLDCKYFYYSGGSLSCNSCKYNFAQCYISNTNPPSNSPRCGNNVKESGEDCDGSAGLSTVSCKGLSEYSYGNVGCTNKCKYDLSKCTATDSNNKCVNKVKDITESDVDCGGDCGTCNIGKSCFGNSDCASNNCVAFKCAVNTCENNALDTKESDVDCGGSCSTKCAIDKKCTANSDCSSGFCSNSKCALEPCKNGIKDGTEIDVDCGGSCQLCSIGKTCNANGDCASDNCVNNVCEYASTQESNDLDDVKSILIIIGSVLVVLGVGYVAYKTVLEKDDKRPPMQNNNYLNSNKNISQEKGPQNIAIDPRSLEKQKEAIQKRKELREKQKESLLKSLGTGLDSTEDVTDKTKSKDSESKEHLKGLNEKQKDKSEKYYVENSDDQEYVDVKSVKSKSKGKSENSKDSFEKLKDIAKDVKLPVNDEDKLVSRISRITEVSEDSLKKTLSKKLDKNKTIELFNSFGKDKLTPNRFLGVLSELLNNGKLEKDTVSSVLFEYMDEGVLTRSEVAKISSELRLI